MFGAGNCSNGFGGVRKWLDGLAKYSSRTVLGKTVERIGRASYHIMYTQMIYYAVRPVFDKMVFDISKLGYAELIIDSTVAVSSGLLFESCLSRFMGGKKSQV